MDTATPEESLHLLTIGDCAELAISRFVHKIDRCAAEVLQDSDPEPLHKMRVGMRRLRTVLQVLEPVVILPSAGTRQEIGKLANVLGAVRDLDIMKVNLEVASCQDIPAREREILAKVAQVLVERRRKAFAKMEKCLAKEYPAFVTAMQKWSDRPQYRNRHLAEQQAAKYLPDLLLPMVAAFFLHAGWFVTDEELRDCQPILHDLRKYTKRIRYQTEYFLPDLGADVSPFLPPLEATQELLGQMQDGLVLDNFIRAAIGKRAVKQLPVLSDLLAQKNIQAWHEWQPIKMQLCSPEWRRSLRLACI